MRGHILGDGSLVFPRRGTQPPDQPGYRRTNNPFVFKPEWHFCPYRVEREVYIEDCRCKALAMICDLTNDMAVGCQLCKRGNNAET